MTRLHEAKRRWGIAGRKSRTAALGRPFCGGTEEVVAGLPGLLRLAALVPLHRQEGPSLMRQDGGDELSLLQPVALDLEMAGQVLQRVEPEATQECRVISEPLDAGGLELLRSRRIRPVHEL